MIIIKKDFSNIDVFAVVKELDEFLSGGTISNIYEVEDLLILKVNTTKGNQNLIIKKDSRLNITQFDYPIPKYPSQYVISLRKFLRNRRILRIYQYNFDRIVIFELSNYDEKPWKFIIELFSKGNYILIDENNKIKIAKRYLKLRNRDILANKEYVFPKSYGDNFLTIKFEGFKEIINKNEEIVRILARNINISGLYSEEVCFNANIDKTKRGNIINDEDLKNLYKSFKDLRNMLMFSDIKAHIIYDNDENQLSVLPFDLNMYKDFPRKYFASFNESVDIYFSKLDSDELITPGDNKLKGQISAQEKILKNQKDYLSSLKEDKKQYYDYGDFIYNNFQNLEKLISTVNNAKKKGYNWEKINDILNNAKKDQMEGLEFFNKIIPENHNIEVLYDEIPISLDLNKSLGENANLIYLKGKKAKKKIDGTKLAIEKTKKKIEKLKKEEASLESKIDFLVKKPSRKWYEKYHWFISIDGFLVIGGRDASSNEAIFRKYIEKYDLVLHTNFPGSPLCIIKNPENDNIPTKTMNEAAIFVASYSQAWKENWGIADVFYVSPQQVSKSPPSGEYLKKGSFMIEGQKTFIRNVKTELAIGLHFIELESNIEDIDKFFYPKISAGPIISISENYDNLIKIIPSRSGYSKGDLAKKIKNQFLYQTKDECKMWVDLLTLNEIILTLPNGLSKIKN